MKQQDIAVIGLAVMGRSLALNMADHGFAVAAYNRSYAVSEQMAKNHPHPHIHIYKELKDCVAALKKPRKVMLMVKAGKAVDMVIEQLVDLLEEGDIILDGGNSFFEDTIRREQALRKNGLHYFGVGVSGGEEGARFGPSIMPGGNKQAYDKIRPILETIAAKASDGKPCCTYIGENGAGHYVKMVHNGIEYADMQLISEAYLQLKYIGGYTNTEIAKIFKEWNADELESFLIRITADIFLASDDRSSQDLLDVIVDSAAQKGTGRWTSIEALKQGVDVSMITASCNARIMSNLLAQRHQAQILYPDRKPLQRKNDAFVETVRQALYAGKILAYAQGFALLAHASSQYDWQLALGEIAAIFRAGCIIQARFLNDIQQAFTKENPASHLLFDPFFAKQLQTHQQALRDMVAMSITQGLAIPAMANAVSYLDMFRSSHSGANLIQAQRDYFGAHTFERCDMSGSFHHEWRRDHE